MYIFTLLFWISFLLIIYAYAGYGLLISLVVYIRKIWPVKRKITEQDTGLPEVTMIVAAYNEAACIENKVRNCMELAYPAEKIHFIFITDGSTDDTHRILSAYPAIQLLHQEERKGKTAALNRAMQFVTTPFVIFSDANTLLNRNAVRNIVRHYRDPRTGGVAGEKKIMLQSSSKAAGAGEGIYWKYESWLKRTDAALYTVVGAAGELFSIRTELFEPLPDNVILDDFVLSLRIVAKSYRFAYEPEAYAMEAPSGSMKEEQKRKIRICAGAFQAMSLLKGLFNVFSYPLAAFQYISHRVMRWTIVPLCLPLLLIGNIILCINGAGIWYNIILVGQISFYMLAGIGYYYANRNIKIKSLYIPYYFFFMNFSVYLGFGRYIAGSQAVTWEKAQREDII